MDKLHQATLNQICFCSYLIESSREINIIKATLADENHQLDEKIQKMRDQLSEVKYI